MSLLLPRWASLSLFSGAVAAASLFCTTNANAVFDKRFDIVTFCCPCSPDDHMCQSQFDHLNWVSTNGHMVVMGTDAHRSEINTNGNFLGAYINDLNTG